MRIQKDMIVSIEYSLKDNNGELIESTNGKKPYEFIFGYNMANAGLEKVLKGLTIGDEIDIVIPASDAYGQKDKSLMLRLHRNDLTEDAIEVGQTYRKIFTDGHSEVYKVTGFLDDWIYLDRNHPLAGKDLHYKVKIINVTPINV